MSKVIGFIGLGNMGKGMSKNLSANNLKILGFDKIVLKKNILIGYIKNFDLEEQKIHLDRLFKYSLNNQNSISFSQKKFNDGEKFIVKIQKINSISKAIQILSEIKD